MKKRLVFFGCFFMFCCVAVMACHQHNPSPLPKQTPQSSEKSKANEEGIEHYLSKLCSERMEGREGGKKGEAEAALYLAYFLQANGVKPAGDDNTYFQAFTINEYEPKLSGMRMVMELRDYVRKTTSENVLGILEGKSPEIVVLSAHYDHLGIIGKECYQGANDNASGVAAVMDIVQKCAEDKPGYTLLIAFWGSEEKGLLGSNYFCLHPTVPWGKIKAIINLDTIGNLKTDHQLLGWQDKEDTFTREIADGLEKAGWQITWQARAEHNSDHWAFAKKGIPGFTLLSPTWLINNHSPLDTPVRVNVPNLQALTDSLRSVLLTLR